MKIKWNVVTEREKTVRQLNNFLSYNIDPLQFWFPLRVAIFDQPSVFKESWVRSSYHWGMSLVQSSQPKVPVAKHCRSSGEINPAVMANWELLTFICWIGTFFISGEMTLRQFDWLIYIRYRSHSSHRIWETTRQKDNALTPNCFQIPIGCFPERFPIWCMLSFILFAFHVSAFQSLIAFSLSAMQSFVLTEIDRKSEIYNFRVKPRYGCAETIFNMAFHFRSHSACDSQAIIVKSSRYLETVAVNQTMKPIWLYLHRDTSTNGMS